jgi:hypothetical protein
MMRAFFISLFIIFSCLACEEQGRYFNIAFDEIHGLAVEDRLVFEGEDIGSVVKISARNAGGYLVHVVIKSDFAGVVTENCLFYVARDSRIQSRNYIKMVELHPGGTPLQEGETIRGSGQPPVFSDEDLGGLAEVFEALTEAFEMLADDFRQIPESPEFKSLEKELEKLTQELKRSGEAARERIEKDILPRIQEEIEKLRRRLKKLKREEKEEIIEI